MSYYRRHLPHWHPDDAWLFVTWCLAGSLTTRPAQEFLAQDRELDRATSGPAWLKDPQVAAMVCAVIHQAESEQALCKLGGYVVMSNHVHLLALPLKSASALTHWIKGVSAHRANRILNRVGAPFWQHESFDHWVRNSRDYGHTLGYIEQNPVRAGLVSSPEQWPWSSAGQASACPGFNLKDS